MGEIWKNEKLIVLKTNIEERESFFPFFGGKIGRGGDYIFCSHGNNESCAEYTPLKKVLRFNDSIYHLGASGKNKESEPEWRQNPELYGIRTSGRNRKQPDKYVTPESESDSSGPKRKKR